MYRFHRKTTPKVVRGRVRPKNRSNVIPRDYGTKRYIPMLYRRKPGHGYRHVLTKTDVVRFLELLPDWDQLSQGLEAIELARGEQDCQGWHLPGIVAICAWEKELWNEVGEEFYEDHKELLERLQVPCRRTEGGYFCGFTEPKVRAYQLLHILLHELGHHHDRMTTRPQREPTRGEDYAERYAHHYEKVVLDRYLAAFGLD